MQMHLCSLAAFFAPQFRLRLQNPSLCVAVVDQVSSKKITNPEQQYSILGQKMPDVTVQSYVLIFQGDKCDLKAVLRPLDKYGA
jgi:hypothetical protein